MWAERARKPDERERGGSRAEREQSGAGAERERGLQKEVWAVSGNFDHSHSAHMLCSTEVQTHAGHSITFNMFLHFVTLWLWPLTGWLKNHITCRISEVHSLHQVWRLWDHSFLSYAVEKQNHTQTDADECFNALLPWMSLAWVINRLLKSV